MTESQAQALQAQIAATHVSRIEAKVVPVRKKHSGLYLEFKRECRSITITKVEQWPEVLTMWALFLEGER